MYLPNPFHLVLYYEKQRHLPSIVVMMVMVFQCMPFDM